MKRILILLLIFNSCTLFAQIESGKDSTAFLDSVFNEMDEILNELISSKSFLSASAGAGTGFFNFKSGSSSTYNPEKKLMFSPAINYLHKSGLGLSGTAYAVSNDGLNFYQFSLSGSYDYIKRGKWSAGMAYTRYFTKDSLSFYTTPIVNEMYAYFNYRKTWLQPGIGLNYGWGSNSSYEKKRLDIIRLRRLRSRQVMVHTKESISDFSLLISVRHNFSWSQIFDEKDLFTLTPILLLSSGTQNFGFNTSFQTRSKIINNFLPNNQYISDKREFDAQSGSVILRADYSVGKLFFQSQMLLDYYFHSANNRLNNAFALIAGVNF
jgi:hypothetical protein